MNDFVIQFTITEKPYGEMKISQLKEMKTQTIMEPLVNSNKTNIIEHLQWTGHSSLCYNRDE